MALIVAFSLALFSFASLVPVVLLWSGSAALNLSLLTSDLWAGLARVLFFGAPALCPDAFPSSRFLPLGSANSSPVTSVLLGLQTSGARHVW